MSFVRRSLVAAALLAPSMASAADYTVCASGCDFSDLQTAVDAAAERDSLLLSAETYLGSVVVDTSIDIIGPSEGYAVLDGDGAAQTLTVTATLVLASRVKITGADGLAGLHVDRFSVLGLDDAFIQDNVGTYGGALVNGVLQSEGLRVQDNEGTGSWSGGVTVKNDSSTTWADWAIVDLYDSEFSRNTGRFGGGLYGQDASLSIADCVFRDNSAGSFGGALAVFDSDVEIWGSTFRRNAAVAGGGVYASRGELTLSDSVFRKNSASVVAGAWLSGEATLDTVVFRENVASVGGATLATSSEFPIVLTDVRYIDNVEPSI